MRTLICSDVHGNMAALQAVLDHATRDGPCELWFLGDCVGYGPEPYRVWLELHAMAEHEGIWLAGNHEWSLLGRETSGRFRKEALDVLTYHRDQLKSKQELIDHISRLPVMSSPLPGVFLTHGDFHVDPATSVMREGSRLELPAPDEVAATFRAGYQAVPERVYAADAENLGPPHLFVYGHTHLARLQRWSAPERKWEELDLQNPIELGDLERAPVMLNPGSVGFPRDGQGCPSYALIDWELRTLQFHRVTYDVDRTRRLMQKWPYAALLGEPRFLPDPTC